MNASELTAYLPLRSLSILSAQLAQIDVTITISKDRASKYGDYQFTPSGHQITINQGLGQYNFLITLVHEIAHAMCAEKHGRRVKPHGIEWKVIFSELLLPYLDAGVFPASIANELSRHVKNPKASSSSDAQLMNALKRYAQSDRLTLLNDLVEGDKFLFGRGREFVKHEKKRTRHLCTDTKSGKSYLISGIAEVTLLKE